MCAHAVDLLGLPRDRIVGITMPGFGTTDATYAAACELITSLGCTFRELEIRGLASEVFESIGHDADVEDLTFENVQAWAR